MRPSFAMIVGAVAIFVSVSAQILSYKLPDPRLTPGLGRSLTTNEVCTTKWGSDQREVTEAMKRSVCVAYSAGPTCPGKAWELDHLISRELAGADDVKNLWPQPIAEARRKDRLENRLHVLVCQGKMSLSDAQVCLLNDWTKCYFRIYGVKP